MQSIKRKKKNNKLNAFWARCLLVINIKFYEKNIKKNLKQKFSLKKKSSINLTNNVVFQQTEYFVGFSIRKIINGQWVSPIILNAYKTKQKKS